MNLRRDDERHFGLVIVNGGKYSTERHRLPILTFVLIAEEIILRVQSCFRRILRASREFATFSRLVGQLVCH